MMQHITGIARNQMVFTSLLEMLLLILRCDLCVFYTHFTAQKSSSFKKLLCVSKF